MISLFQWTSQRGDDFAHQLVRQADRFVRFGVPTHVHLHAGFFLEIVQDLLGEFAIVSTVNDKARIGPAAAEHWQEAQKKGKQGAIRNEMSSSKMTR